MSLSTHLLIAAMTAVIVQVSGGEWAYSDYLPMSYLTSSRSAQEMSSASKLVFFDYLPSELNGKKAKHLEIRSANSVSCHQTTTRCSPSIRRIIIN